MERETTVHGHLGFREELRAAWDEMRSDLEERLHDCRSQLHDRGTQLRDRGTQFRAAWHAAGAKTHCPSCCEQVIASGGECPKCGLPLNMDATMAMAPGLPWTPPALGTRTRAALIAAAFGAALVGGIWFGRASIGPEPARDEPVRVAQAPFGEPAAGSYDSIVPSIDPAPVDLPPPPTSPDPGLAAPAFSGPAPAWNPPVTAAPAPRAPSRSVAAPVDPAPRPPMPPAQTLEQVESAPAGDAPVVRVQERPEIIAPPHQFANPTAGVPEQARVSVQWLQPNIASVEVRTGE